MVLMLKTAKSPNLTTVQFISTIVHSMYPLRRMLDPLSGFSEHKELQWARPGTVYKTLDPIEIVRKLAMANPKLCAWSGGIILLIDSIMDPSVGDISE